MFLEIDLWVVLPGIREAQAETSVRLDRLGRVRREDIDFVALRKHLLRRAQNLTRNIARIDAEDLVQTAMMKVVNAFDEGTVIRNPFAFAMTTLVHTFNDERRRSSAAELSPPETEMGQEPGPEIEELIAVRQQVAALPDNERAFLVARVVEQRTLEDAQRQAGWPEKSAKFNLDKILLALGKRIT